MILFVVCLMIMGMQSVKAQNAKIILHHQGTVSFFTANNIQAALDASVDGDTIYLNEGEFPGDLTVSKDISIIGCGDWKSIINGNLTLAIKGNITHSIEGIYITGNLTVTEESKGLTLRKCVFYRIYFDKFTNDAVIERCWGSFLLSSNVGGLYVSNSRIAQIEGDAPAAENAVFNNCNIGNLFNRWYTYGNSSVERATYRNCIIGSWSDNHHDVTTVYINCLCGQNLYVNSEDHNCWTLANIVDDNYNVTISVEELAEKDYLGTDGTIVGMYGGETPFSLQTTVPKITDYSSTVDPKTKKVTVNLKVANQ